MFHKKCLFAFVIAVVFITLSCASTEVMPKSSVKQSEKKTELKPAPVQKAAKPVPPATPEVQFAQNVSTALESGNAEKALALFDTCRMIRN